MTDQEIRTTIIEKLKKKNIEFDPAHLSAMVIIGYLDDIAKHGMIETAFSVNESGRIVQEIRTEFGLKPSNEDILSFINETIEEADRSPFAVMIVKYRDDKEEFISFLSKFPEFDTLFNTHQSSSINN